MTQRYFSSTAGQMVLQSNISSSATSLIVDTVTGLPGATPFVVVLDPGTSLEEICDVTALAGTTLTVTRGVDGSPAVAHSSGAFIRHMAIARDFREANTHVNTTSGVHGVAGALVGTTDSQALTNKDLTNGTNAFPTTLASTASLSAHTGATAGVHGVSGSVVGTTDTQTLTNKTINSPVIATPTISSPTVSGTITGPGAFSGPVSGTTGTFTGAVTAANLPFTLMQKGSVAIAVSSGANFASAVVTFPTAFAGTPMVFVSIADAAGGTAQLVPRSFGPSTTGVTVAVYTGNNPTGVPSNTGVTVNWMAVY